MRGVLRTFIARAFRLKSRAKCVAVASEKKVCRVFTLQSFKPSRLPPPPPPLLLCHSMPRFHQSRVSFFFHNLSSFFFLFLFRKSFHFLSSVALWFRTARNPDVSTRPLACPFVRTAHSFACFTLLHFARALCCPHLFVFSPAHSIPSSWEIEWLDFSKSRCSEP